MPYPPPKELLEYLAAYDEPVRTLALATRNVVLKEMAPCLESVVDAYNAVALGYGPTECLRDMVCHIAVYPEHVNIGLNRGSEIDAPPSLLEGSGRRTRHITIRTTVELKNPAVKTCLRTARELAGMKQSTRHLKGVTTVIKKPYARKRRPHPGRARAASSAR